MYVSLYGIQIYTEGIMKGGNCSGISFKQWLTLRCKFILYPLSGISFFVVTGEVMKLIIIHYYAP